MEQCLLEFHLSSHVFICGLQSIGSQLDLTPIFPPS